MESNERRQIWPQIGLDELTRIKTEIHTGQEAIRSLVYVLREDHVSWSRIGGALGVTQQSAHKRFSSISALSEESGEIESTDTEISSATSLGRLVGLSELKAIIETQIDKDVEHSRQTGATWDQIGSSLGISSSLAHYRYGR